MPLSRIIGIESAADRSASIFRPFSSTSNRARVVARPVTGQTRFRDVESEAVD